MPRNWRWCPRLDLDLAQRCLFIIFSSWVISSVLQTILPSFIYSSLSIWKDLLTIAILLGAVAKSSVQFLPEGKSVLVTGCDSGFGLELAKHLTKLGFKVFAGCLGKNQKGPGAKELETFAKRSNGLLHVLQLDVTNEQDWQAAIAYITKECPDGLWGVVSNAGWSTFGEVEWVPMNTYRKIMEVNVFGLMRGMQICMPWIRKARGRVVTITSGLARMAMPTRSPYVVSKYAVMGLLECFRYEMEGFGVKVCMIEPGNFLAGTSLFNDKIINASADEMWKYMSEDVRSAYGEQYFNERKQIMSSYMTSGLSDLTPVIRAYTDGLLDVFPQKRYQPMNIYFKIRVFVATHLPEIFYDWIYIPYVKREEKKE